MFKFKNKSLYKPCEMAYTEFYKLKFMNGKSQIIPMAPYEGFFLVPFSSLNSSEIILNTGEKTVVVHRHPPFSSNGNCPSLVNPEKDVHEEHYSFARKLFEKCMMDKNTTDKDDKDFYKQHIYDELVKHEVVDIMRSKDNVIFHPNSLNWGIFEKASKIIAQYGETVFETFIYSLYLKAVIKDYGLHFEIQSRYLDENEDGSTSVIIDGVEKPAFNDFLNDIMNGLTMFWSPSYFNVWRATKKIPEIAELENRKEFSERLTKIAYGLKTATDNIGGEKRLNGHKLLKMLGLKSNTVGNSIRFVVDLYNDSKVKTEFFAKIGKHLNFDYSTGIASKCQLVNSLIDNIFRLNDESANLENIISMLKDPNDQWLLYHCWKEIKGIFIDDRNSNIFINFFLVITKFLRYQIPSEDFQKFVFDGIQNIIRKVTEMCDLVDVNEEEAVKLVKENWKKYPYRIEILYLAKFFWDTLFKPAIELIMKDSDRQFHIFETHMNEILDENNIQLNEKTKEWINFLHDFAKKINKEFNEIVG